MPEVIQHFKLVMMFISGRARGTQQIVVKLEKPSAEVSDLWSGTVFFEGEDRGANLVIDMQQKFELEGLYWFQIMLGADQLTRLPFRLIYERVGLPNLRS